MKTFPVCVLIAICFITKGSSETLRCYNCDDCYDLKLDESMLQSCPLSDTTTSTTTQNPTHPSTSPTEDDSTTPKLPEESTSTTESTDTSTTTTASPTEKTSTTNEPQVESTSTTVTANNPPLIPSNNPELLPIDAPPASIINSPQLVQSIPESSEPEVVDSYVPEPALQPYQYQNNQPYQIVNRFPRPSRSLRSVLRDGDEPKSHHCYSIDVLDGDSRKVKKGCVEVPESKSACDVLKDKFKESAVEKCSICSKDKCNSASMIKYSVITTLMMALVLSFYST